MSEADAEAVCRAPGRKHFLRLLSTVRVPNSLEARNLPGLSMFGRWLLPGPSDCPPGLSPCGYLFDGRDR